MDGRFSKPFVGKPEEPGIRPEKMIDTPSSKRSRRAVQKRVVSVPIADVDGSRTKGEGAPPSDSWAWRKYGQKPIKGSPYPRGYYRCSSSKGCPARKQVERSRVDPTMLLITYACEHNHPWPTARNSTSTAPPRIPPEKPPPAFRAPPEAEPETDGKLPEMENDPTLLADEFGWFSDVASSPTEIAVLESPIYAGEADDVAEALYPMREEDESLYADLGELPECSLVFRRGFWEREESSLRAETWCGSTG